MAKPVLHGRDHLPGHADPIPGLESLGSGSGGILPIGSSTGWHRRTVPLISATVGWENGVVEEPTVLYESGTWKMWFSGGWTSSAIGYAECTTDPTVTANWTKYAGNPVLGQGGSSISGYASGNNVIKDGSTYYCFYYASNGGGALKVATSTDGKAWTAVGTVHASGSTSGTHGWANTTVWKEGSTWHMIVEGTTNVSGGSPWQLYHSTSSSLTSGWSTPTGPLSSLDLAAYVDGASGPNFAEIDGVITPKIDGTNYQVWYHANAISGSFIVSDIFHGTGSTVAGLAVAGGDIQADRGTYEKDQAADPCVLQVAGVSYLFYDGVDNTTPLSYINLATYDGPLSALTSTISTPTAFDFQQILLEESTSSTTYTDLASVGPAATVSVGTNGIVLVGWNAQFDGSGLASIALSGANTLTATDNWALIPGGTDAMGRTYAFTGLAAGDTTFTVRYRVGSGTHSFLRRSVWALAL